ncbi:hypothetical protein C8Q74DRAFT_595457 [Fomes fomentarius]|nr:hypothetical protein C8Q74DRAFT_595457 [Fomes fomentarius]
MSFAYITDRRRTRPFNATVTVLIGTLLVLYVTTAVYWVITLWATMNSYTILFVSSVQQIQSSLKNTAQCLESALSDHPSLGYTSLNSTCVHIPSTPSQYYSVDDRLLTQMCMGNVAVMINVTIGDAIVWWRALVIWQWNRVVCGIGMVLVLATFGMLTYTAFLLTVSKSPSWKYDVLHVTEPREYLGVTFAASCLSLCTNIIATSLIAYKAWTHRKLVRSYLSNGSTRQLVEKVLLVLVESGALYCVLSVRSLRVPYRRCYLM